MRGDALRAPEPRVATASLALALALAACSPKPKPGPCDDVTTAIDASVALAGRAPMPRDADVASLQRYAADLRVAAVGLRAKSVANPPAALALSAQADADVALAAAYDKLAHARDQHADADESLATLAVITSGSRRDATVTAVDKACGRVPPASPTSLPPSHPAGIDDARPMARAPWPPSAPSGTASPTASSAPTR